jgi:ribosomal-protein-alanine N-acetyltransferase
MKKLHIGNVRLGPIDSQFKKSNFGILIGNKNFHGQGVATEVLELIKRFSFDYLKLDKIYFPVVEENAAAMNLYAKSKFVCSGEMKKKFIKNKKSFKLIKWTMSKLDYKKEKKNA